MGIFYIIAAGLILGQICLFQAGPPLSQDSHVGGRTGSCQVGPWEEGGLFPWKGILAWV